MIKINHSLLISSFAELLTFSKVKKSSKNANKTQNTNVVHDNAE